MLDLQPTLFELPPLVKPAYESGMTLRQRWWEFHKANLHIYEILRKMAFELKAQGYQHCGIKLLWERLRWESYVQTKGTGEYRLSNSFPPFYSRFLMAREPQLKGFFGTKYQPSEER